METSYERILVIVGNVVNSTAQRYLVMPLEIVYILNLLCVTSTSWPVGMVQVGNVLQLFGCSLIPSTNAYELKSVITF